MNKRQLHHTWTKLRDVQLRYLAAVFILLVVIAGYELRQNNLHMIELRNAVYIEDQNNGDVETALEDLRAYVTGHMNTSLSSGKNTVYPPVQLKFTYDRLVQAAGQNTTASNESIYNDAQKSCEQQIPNGFSGRFRLDCIEQYVSTHGGGSVTNIPDSLYKFDFVSPTWSPDLAGFSVLLAVLSGLLLVGLYVWRRVLEYRSH